MTGQSIRERFALRLRVVINDQCMGDVGTSEQGVRSCATIVEDAATEIDGLQRALDAAVSLLEERNGDEA